MAPAVTVRSHAAQAAPGGPAKPRHALIPRRTIHPKPQLANAIAMPRRPASVSTPAAGLVVSVNAGGLAAADEGGCCTPPDSTGSIGPGHYVEMVNGLVRVSDRLLQQVSQATLDSFIGAPGDSLSDPQIEWDQQGGRWLYAALDLTNLGIALGWSKTADPTDLVGGWCRFAISTGAEFHDFPKLGHDDNFLSIGTNVFVGSNFNTFITATIWAVPKPAVGATTCPSAPVASRFGTATSPLLNADHTRAFTPVPADTSDSSAAGYILAARSNLVASTKIMVWHLHSNAGTPTLVADGDATVSAYVFPLNAPQAGGSGFVIDTSDARLTQAVAHADPGAGGLEAIWTQHAVAANPDGSGNSVVRWYEIVPGAGTPVRQEGTVADPDNYLFNAAISPTTAGDEAVIDYSVSGTATYPTIKAQSRIRTTPRATMGGEVTLAASTVADTDFSCLSGPCRWGDYPAASPDPRDRDAVWGTNMLTGTGGTGSSAGWATSNFGISLRPPAAQSAPATGPQRVAANQAPPVGPAPRPLPAIAPAASSGSGLPNSNLAGLTKPGYDPLASAGGALGSRLAPGLTLSPG